MDINDWKDAPIIRLSIILHISSMKMYTCIKAKSIDYFLLFFDNLPVKN